MVNQNIPVTAGSGEESKTFFEYLTDSLISEGVLDTMRDQGLFGRIGANVLGELTSPLGIASTALLATGVGAPIGAGIRAATGARAAAAAARGVQASRGATALARAGSLAAGAFEPVTMSARGLTASQILRSRGILGRSLAGEAVVGAGAIAGGGLAQETGKLIPGPTRSTPGQIALGVTGGLAGAGTVASGFSHVLDQEAAIRAAITAPNPIEAEIPGLSVIRENFQKTTRSNAELKRELSTERARRIGLSVEAESQFPNDPQAAARAGRAASAGQILDRQRFQPLAEGEPLNITPNQTALDKGLTADTFDKVLRRADDVYAYDYNKRTNAKEAFTKMMLGAVPTPGEYNLLRPVVGDAFVDQVKAVASGRGRRGFDLAMQVLGTPRQLMASFDMSSVLRQGGILTVSHPKRQFWGKDSAFGLAVKAIKDPEFAATRNAEIRNHPDIQFLNSDVDVQDKLFLHEYLPKGAATDVTRTEEIWMSKFASAIPGIGASERFFTTNLNEMRYGMALDHLRVAREQTPEIFLPENAGRLRAWKIRNNRYINSATGRGSLGALERPVGNRAGQIELVRDALSIGMWSPRLVISRFQSIQEAIRALKGLRATDPEIRQLSREIAKDYATYIAGVTGAISALSFLPGVDVEVDPRSADFGKVRIGDTRIDPWAGFQQVVRFATQITTGQRKTVSTGEVDDVERSVVLGKFLRSKLAPGFPSVLASDLPRDIFPGLTGGGKNFIGEPLSGVDVTPGAGATVVSLGQMEQLPAEMNVLIDQMIPLLAQDIADALETGGYGAAARSGVSTFFGLGSQSYNDNTKSTIANKQPVAANQDDPVQKEAARRIAALNAAFQ